MAGYITNPSSEIDCLASMWVDLLLIRSSCYQSSNVAEAGGQAGNMDADDPVRLDVCQNPSVSDALI